MVLTSSRYKWFFYLEGVPNYELLPIKFSFSTNVRIYCMVISFVFKCRKNKKMVGAILREGELTFSVFLTQAGNQRGSDEH